QLFPGWPPARFYGSIRSGGDSFHGRPERGNSAGKQFRFDGGKAGLLDQLGDFLARRKSENRPPEIGVGFPLSGEKAADHRERYHHIKLVKRRKPGDRARELEKRRGSLRKQNPMSFGKNSGKIEQIAK